MEVEGASSTLSNSKGSATFWERGKKAEKVGLDCRSLAIMAEDRFAVVWTPDIFDVGREEYYNWGQKKNQSMNVCMKRDADHI
jgi:hypothetical protein